MHEHAQWDIVSGVGITALGVAATRALEGQRPDALVHDPFAAAFVTAARPHTDAPMPLTPAELDALFPPSERPTTEAGLAQAWWPVMTEYIGVRTRFFDEALRDACASGVRQLVLLAAGLDTRAQRLSWPDGTVVFEVDQPRVLEFKDQVLAEHGVRPACERRSVPVDLRGPWADALVERGFDPARPVAWLAEGLLPYLPAEAHEELFATVDDLSPTGSRFAAEDVATGLRAAASGGDAEGFGTDIAALFPDETMLTPERRLTSRHWRVTAREAPSVADGYGRRLTGGVRQVVGHCTLLTAQRP